MASELQDLLNEELKENREKIFVSQQFDFIVGQAEKLASPMGRSKTLGQAKSLLEYYDLVRQAIDDYESRKAINEILGFTSSLVIY